VSPPPFYLSFLVVLCFSFFSFFLSCLFRANKSMWGRVLFEIRVKHCL
jgi:hypothetical protein